MADAAERLECFCVESLPGWMYVGELGHFPLLRRQRSAAARPRFCRANFGCSCGWMRGGGSVPSCGISILGAFTADSHLWAARAKAFCTGLGGGACGITALRGAGGGAGGVGKCGRPPFSATLNSLETLAVLGAFWVRRVTGSKIGVMWRTGGSGRRGSWKKLSGSRNRMPIPAMWNRTVPMKAHCGGDLRRPIGPK